MTRNEAKDQIKAIPLAGFFGLEKSSKSRLYNCPLCGSGTGPHKTGALEIFPDNGYKCHRCGAAGDIFTLYQKLNGLPDGAEGFAQALEGIASKAGISLDGPSKSAAKKDLSAYYRRCQEALMNSPDAQAYLEGRKIHLETALRYGIGFDPQADPAGANHPCPRIIIPTSKDHYIGRAIDSATPKEYAKLNNKGADPAIWNIKALYRQEVQEVFVVEGVFDALSIIEAGSEAIALNSTSNTKRLADAIQEKKPKCKLILCLDADEAGQRASELLQAELQSAGVPYIRANVCYGQKDPNEALQKCEGRFREAVKRAISEAQKPDNTALFLDRNFYLERERAAFQIRTGYSELDAKTDGGLTAGLYIVAAGTSLGKTTFCLQMADSIAASGNEVLYISMEQSKLELVCKSLTRTATELNAETKLTADRIRQSKLSAQEDAEVHQAIGIYKEKVKDRVSILEGNFGFNIAQIKQAVIGYIERTGKRPVVFVDYLQILRPSEKNQTSKENMDATITELKTLSRDYKICIVAISSINRMNYNNANDLDSLAQSQGLEYTADSVFFLYYRVMKEGIFQHEGRAGEKREAIRKARSAYPREIILACTKNRFGKNGWECEFQYYPSKDRFAEAIFLKGQAETDRKKAF